MSVIGRKRRLTPPEWVDRMLTHKGKKSPGIYRRQASSIPLYMTKDVIREELRKRSYTLIVSGDNMIALSHDKPIAIYR
jgi:hypothetical protein